MRITDPDLGPLRWEDTFSWWAGALDTRGGGSADLYLSITQQPSPDALKRAAGTVSRFHATEAALRHAATAELLEIFNSEWNDGSPLDATSFMAHMKLEAMTVYEDGAAEIYYADGGLFDGHTILIRIGPDGDFREVALGG